MQPDIPEEDEIDDDILAEIAKLDHQTDKSDHGGTAIPHEREMKETRLGWLWVGGFVFLHENIPHISADSASLYHSSASTVVVRWRL